MIVKGKVSSIELNGIRVVLPERENNVSPPLKTAHHVGELSVGNDVVVLFFSNSMVDGIIIAKF